MMTDHVTDPAKLDIIAATQAEENEWRRVGVSRCFACKCADRCVPQHAYALTQRIR